MRKMLNRRRIVLPTALVALAMGLFLTATQAHASYAGYYGHSYSGYQYRGPYPYRYGHERRGYRGRLQGRYGHSYGYSHPGYYGGHHRRQYRYSRGRAYGLLSIPRAGLGSVFNYNGSHARQRDDYSVGSIVPPAGTSTVPDAANSTGSGSVYSAGWTHLANGRYSQALSIFATEIGSRPSDGALKVGYALSAAGTGDFRRGVWAMRRALKVDPDSVHYVAVDGSLRRQVERLLARYQQNEGNALDRADAALMIASLHYLLGDTAAARASFNAAVAYGETSPSATNLKRLINVKITTEKQRARDAELAPAPQGGTQ